MFKRFPLRKPKPFIDKDELLNEKGREILSRLGGIKMKCPECDEDLRITAHLNDQIVHFQCPKGCLGFNHFDHKIG